MNVILVLIDSLNRHHLRAYNPEAPVPTPNLDRLASKAYRFDNHFVGSLPCMPARREIFAGRKEFLWRPWGPLEQFDDRLPKLLENNGYSTNIVTDHYHYWEEESGGYIQSFQGAQLVRGHEVDFWKGPVPDGESVPKWVQNIERWRPGDWPRRYYGNVRDFEGEEDYFPAKVFSGAARWLTDRATSGDERPFFLQVESFDVHEPFDVPEPCASMFGDAAGRDMFTVWPPYTDSKGLARFMAGTSEEELDFIRSQYFGKLAMVDRWLGVLFDRLDEHALWDETAVVLTTDHGHDLAERGVFGKQYPHFDSHANIPLFVWHPEKPGNGASVQALTQTVDLFSTVLDAAGITDAERAHGHSVLPLLDGGAGPEALLYGTFGQGVCVTDGRWTLFKSPENKGPLNYYSSLLYRSLVLDTVAPPADNGYFVPGVKLPQWQVPVRVGLEKINPEGLTDFLFDRSEDPGQQNNLWEEAPHERERMLELAWSLISEERAPPEQFERLGLSV